MAHVAIVGSHSTNGVAAIHSELLRKTTVKDLAEVFPERFNNKTNGVTPRRWLKLANPWLSTAISGAIGDGWITDLAELQKLRPLAKDATFLRERSKGPTRVQGALRRLGQKAHRRHRRSAHHLRLPDQAHSRIQAPASQRSADRRSLPASAGEPGPRYPAAHVLLRRQGGAGLLSRKSHHQVHQQPRSNDRR